MRGDVVGRKEMTPRSEIFAPVGAEIRRRCGVLLASGFTMLGRQIITAGPKGKAITFYA